ncbi:efflux RND transporter periplasmic adaptor subunit [Arenimonas terrae]|uniref:Efflux RND transporter periplasmic adaptor subunit n=1 Tax=Arenimonas terrae TaxID=2546226 RepID=A0A5C4RSN5_9GAMM|nr:efflux RND transporter periplasmic adaptor subunit [Arenimonas terrae]TNJ33944.1 efflux RND transporter periplasmic adaptor subunit [Arenimonas terrae]
MNNSPDLLNQLRIDRSAAPPPRPAGRGPWPAIAVAAVVLVAAGAWWALREEPLAVRTAAAQPEAAGTASAGTSVLDASGYVTARRIATVSSKVTGKVLEVLIEEGQKVKAGEVLARLEPTDADAQRDLSAAQLEAARSNVTGIAAQLKLADQNLVRMRDMAARKLVATAMLDQAQAERDALAAQLQSARSNLQVAVEALALSDIGVDNTVVRAPFDGVITVKAAQPGEIISPMSAGGGFTRTGIGTVVDMDSLEIQVDVNEAFIGRVKPKQKVEAVLNAYPDWRIPAEVIAIVPTADRSKATVKVRIAFKEKDERVVPDMGVRVSFLEEAKPAEANAPAITGVTVPSEAVVQREGKTVAYVVRDGRASLREIEAGDTRDGQRRILRGLAVGEQVVLAPPAELADGGKVAVTP